MLEEMDMEEEIKISVTPRKRNSLDTFGKTLRRTMESFDSGYNSINTPQTSLTLSTTRTTTTLSSIFPSVSFHIHSDSTLETGSNFLKSKSFSHTKQNGSSPYYLRSRNRKVPNNNNNNLNHSKNSKIVSKTIEKCLNSLSYPYSYDCIDENTEKLEKFIGNAHSTPFSSPKPFLLTKTPEIKITFSPKSSKSISIEHKKLSKLRISPFVPSPDIKPKRLDFNIKSDYTSTINNNNNSLNNNNVNNNNNNEHLKCKQLNNHVDYTGRETVDILSLLGEKSNHWKIINKILCKLSPQDLCSVSIVSKTWRKLCLADSNSNLRRLQYVRLKQNTKENLRSLRSKSKLINDSTNNLDNTISNKTSDSSLSKNIFVKKGYLVSVQNLLQVPHHFAVETPTSPPVSPSKVIFHSYVKASRSLQPWERLFRCPKCSFASHMDGEKNVGICTKPGCGTTFCTFCFSTPHTGPCETLLLATPTKKKRHPQLQVGSKQSKRNLRRL